MPIRGIGCRTVAVAGSLMALAISGCSDGSQPVVSAERAVLERELEKLSEYLKVDLGRLLVEGDLLIVMRQELVADLLESALPLEGQIAGGHRVRLEEAQVEFRTALATVRLEGRVTAADRPGTFADITLHAFLELMGIGGEPPVLQARPRVLAVETRDVAIGGLSPPAERLVDELTRRRLGELERLLGVLELPVSVERALVLPGVESDGVQIPPLSLHLGATVDQVLVADRRLWVMVDLELSDREDPPARSEPARAVGEAS